MSKSFRIMIIFFLIFLKNTTSSLTETQINFPNTQTSDFQGLFARKITKDIIYISNLQEDIKYDITTNTVIVKYTQKSTCYKGTVCPFLLNDKYIISKSGKVVKVKNLETDTSISKNSNDKVRGIVSFDENNVLIVDGIGGGLLSYVYVIKMNIATGSLTTIAEWYYTDDAGVIYLTEISRYLLFTYYSTSNNFYYGYLNGSNLVWVEIINTGMNQSTGYFQIIELKEHKIITCSLSNDKSVVRCLMGEYSNSSSFSFTTKTTVIEIVRCSGGNDLFSIYKINENYGLIGCGVNPLKIQKINYNLELVDDVLEIGTNNFFIDFVLLTETKLYAIMAKLESNGKYGYYHTIFYLPYCVSDKIIITFSEHFPLIKLFTHSSSSEITHIIIVSEPVNGDIRIIADDSEASLNTIYLADTLYYKPNSSSNDKFDYRAIDINSQPPKQWESEICSITIVVCYKSCLSCSEKGDSSNHHCNQCDNDNGYYPMDGVASNCYDNSTKPTNYYFDNNSNSFKKCYDTCASCSQAGDNEHHNCDTCDINSGYHLIEGGNGKCVSGTTTLSGYILYNNQFLKCYETCKECNKPLIGTNENCLECQEGYMEHPLVSTNCVKKCEKEGQRWYIGSNNSYNCIEEDKCTGFYPFLIEETNQCVSSCTDLFSCPYCIANQPLFEYNDKCIKKCPNGILVGNKCNQILPEQEKPIVTDNTIQYTSQSSKEEFIDIKNQAIELIFKEENENSGELNIFQGEDYSFNVYPSDIDSSITKENNLPRVDLGECEAILRKVNEIPEEEELFIGQMVYEPTSSTSATKPVQYEVYTKNGTHLDMDPCDSVNIKITQPLTNTDNLNLDLAKKLAEEGIDIYDGESSIFNDICTTFSIDGKDMTLSDRREDIFTNATFCTEGCSLSNLNLTTNEVECDCKTQKDGISSILEENEIFSAFSSLLSSTNLELFLCIKLVFHPSKELGNIGNWFMLANTITTVTLGIVFFAVNLTSIYSFLNTQLKGNPGAKIQLPDLDFVDSINLSNKKLEEKEELQQYSDRAKINNFFPEEPTSKTKLELKAEKNEKNVYKLTNQETGYSREEISLTEGLETEELNELPFEEAIKKDNRKFCQYYFSILIEKQIILSTILSKSLFYPLSARIIMLLFSMCSFFFLNALFFTEEYISERYNSGETLNIFYILKNEISKSFYASMIGMLIGKVLSMVTSTGVSFTKLFRCKKDWDYFINFKNLVNEMRKKYFAVISLIMLLTLVYWYFLFIFCSVYRNNQVSWIQSSLISIFINIIIPIVLCLIIALIRAIAFKSNNR